MSGGSASVKSWKLGRVMGAGVAVKFWALLQWDGGWGSSVKHLSKLGKVQMAFLKTGPWIHILAVCLCCT